MQKEPFDACEYESICKRIQQLESRVKLDRGPEQDNAKRLLKKLLEKLEEYKKTHSVPQNARRTEKTASYTPHNRTYGTGYHDRTPEQMYEEFGVLYLIFGEMYKTYIYGHHYKLEFVKRAEDQEPAFYRVHAKLYEDEEMICDDIIVGFWPWNCGGTRCEDMEFAIYDRGYKRGAPYIEISCCLRDVWNYFFDHQTRLEGVNSRYALLRKFN